MLLQAVMVGDGTLLTLTYPMTGVFLHGTHDFLEKAASAALPHTYTGQLSTGVHRGLSAIPEAGRDCLAQGPPCPELEGTMEEVTQGSCGGTIWPWPWATSSG